MNAAIDNTNRGTRSPWRRRLLRSVIAAAAVCGIVFFLHGCWLPTYIGQGAIAGKILTPMTFLNIHASDARWVFVRGRYFEGVHMWQPPYYATIPGSDSVVVPVELRNYSCLKVVDPDTGRVRTVPGQGFGMSIGDRDPEWAESVIGLRDDQLRITRGGVPYRIDLNTGEWTRDE